MNPASSGTGIPTQIGPYRIEREIARGGMGIVYLARDTRLDRAAAIKALPDDVAADPERLARFEREAKVLASLNHPNIAGIYGVEESGGRRYLALEHIEGETLAARIARGPLPLAETLEICSQIAAGVEAAHESGVIHRDLKPGNVMITPGEHVKVLDFGLAKGKVADESSSSHPAPLAESPTLSSPTLAHSPTFASPATLPGVILGTAAYLSPEQARGKAVDRRTDIWSFGCVLYECLTGKLAFEGETVSDTIAKILEREVDWSRLPKSTPPRVRELLQRCFEKDPKKRLRDIGDARLALEEVRAGGASGAAGAATAAGHPASRRRLPSLGTVFIFLMGFAVAAAAWNLLHLGAGASVGRAVTRLSIAVPPEIQPSRAYFSPDGRAMVLLGRPRAKEGVETPPIRLYRRRLDEYRMEPIEETDGVTGARFTMDGRWILFVAPVSARTTQMRLAKVPVDGSSPPVTITTLDPSWTGFATLHSGDVLMESAGQTQYVRIPGNGGAPSKSLGFGLAGFNGSFRLVEALPADRGVLVNAISYESGGFQINVGVLDLKSGKTKILIKDGGWPRYVSTGHLLFSRGDALLAVPFDLDRLEIKGEPVAIMKGLRTEESWADAWLMISRDGTLFYVPGGVVGSGRRLVVVDAQGRTGEWSGERQSFETTPSLSPDGGSALCVIPNARAIYEIWLSERGKPAARRIVAMPGADCGDPLWSPDGRQIAYSRIAYDKDDGIYVQSLYGAGVPRRIYKLESKDIAVALTSWSPDGSTILFHRTEAGQTDVYQVAVNSEGERPPEGKPLVSGPASQRGGRFFPDGRSIAFVSDESGRDEVYVAAYGPGGTVGIPVMASAGGGSFLRLSRDGKKLFYVSRQSTVMSVAIQTQPALAASAPVPHWDLQQLRVNPFEWDLTPDGGLFAIQKGVEEDDVTRYDVVLNFTEELKERLKAAKK
jgi:Tol biopolymer transport system component